VTEDGAHITHPWHAGAAIMASRGLREHLPRTSADTAPGGWAGGVVVDARAAEADGRWSDLPCEPIAVVRRISSLNAKVSVWSSACKRSARVLMTNMRKVAVIASASGNGKTMLGRELALRLGVPCIELDALVHGPDWLEAPDEELRAQLEPIVASDGWVIDGTYEHKPGDPGLGSADTVVWLDLAIGVWLPRFLRRTARRLRDHRVLRNGNSESLPSALWGRQSLFVWVVRSHFRRRSEWPRALATLPVVRLVTPAEVERFLAETHAPTR